MDMHLGSVQISPHVSQMGLFAIYFFFCSFVLNHHLIIAAHFLFSLLYVEHLCLPPIAVSFLPLRSACIPAPSHTLMLAADAVL